jgi:replicative DNA helicase
MDKLDRKSLQKLPPYNLEAEQAVLGAILLDNTAIHTALEVFDSDDFYRKSHLKIFQAMLTLLDGRQMEVDLLTLRDELERQRVLNEIGGPAYLAALVDQVPTAANIEFHARIVHEKAIARNLLNASIEIATRCYDDSEDVQDLLGDAEQKIFTIAEGRQKQGFVGIDVVTRQSFTRLEDLQERGGGITGVPTGFVDLDEMLSGLQPSDLIILAARPAMGKSAFACNISNYAGVRQQIPTAIFSLEMSKEQLGIRMLCTEAKVNSQKARKGQLFDNEWERLAYASELLAKAPIYIDDTPAISLVEMRAKAKRLKLEKGLGLMIVDYLQLMRPDRRHESKTVEVEEQSRGLKVLAKELDIPVLCLSQLSREVEKRQNKRPQLSDLRWSGGIEQDADVVMFIYRPEAYDIEDAAGLAEIIIGKQRMGPTGSVQLVFIKEYTRFESLDLQHIPEENPLGGRS